MLGVVEQQERAFALEAAAYRLCEVGTLAHPEAERFCNGREHECRLGEGRKRNPEDAIGEIFRDFRRRLQRQTRLAGATGACERQHPEIVLNE